jgi:hypothetical protein
MIEHRWRKSTRSDSGSTCVEVRSDLRAIRDSKNPTGPALTFSIGAIERLVADIKAGKIS